MSKFWLCVYFLGSLGNFIAGSSDRCKDHAAVHIVVAAIMGVVFAIASVKTIIGESDVSTIGK